MAGNNPRLDQCIKARSEINNFLRQDSEQKADRNDTLGSLNKLVELLS